MLMCYVTVHYNWMKPDVVKFKKLDAKNSSRIEEVTLDLSFMEKKTYNITSFKCPSRFRVQFSIILTNKSVGISPMAGVISALRTIVVCDLLVYTYI